MTNYKKLKEEELIIIEGLHDLFEITGLLLYELSQSQGWEKRDVDVKIRRDALTNVLSNLLGRLFKGYDTKDVTDELTKFSEMSVLNDDNFISSFNDYVMNKDSLN
jgi:hypothetical protein